MIRLKFFALVVFLSATGVTIGVVIIARLLNQVSTEPYQIQTVTRYDFGPVHLKQMLRHTFILVNPFDDETLQVTKVHRSCGCGASKLGTSEIPPHGSTTLQLSIPAPDKTGKIQVQTLVFAKTNKTKRPFQFILFIEAQPTSVVEIQDSHPFIQLGQFYLDDLPITKTLTLKKGQHPMDWEALECRSYSSNIVATIIKTAPEKWNLDLELRNTGYFGDIRSFLEFSFLKNGKAQTYRLVKPVQVSIAGPIIASPKSILIGAIQAGERVERNVRLVSTQNSYEPLKIISVESPDSNGIKAEVFRQGSEEVISVVFAATGKKGPCSGSILIKAKLDKIYQMQIRYLAYIL